MLRQFLTTLTIGAAFAMPSTTFADEPLKALNFGIISTESAQNLRQDWQPVLDDMSRAVGMKVTAFFAPDYAGVIEAMRFNKIQFAWLGNKSAIEAVDRANGEVFAQTVNADGTTGYYSYISVHKDSPYNTIEELLKDAKAVRFGIGDPNSTSGFLVPSYYVFAQEGVNPKTAFKAVRSGNHETNILAIANKQVDAATHSSDVLDRIKSRQPEVASQLRQIWKSPLIAADPLVWRRDLSPELKAGIKTFFLNYAKQDAKESGAPSREKAALQKLTFSGFRESSNAQLKPIRQLELFKEKTRLEGDDTLQADEKKQKLDDLGRKLAELAKPLAP